MVESNFAAEGLDGGGDVNGGDGRRRARVVVVGLGMVAMSFMYVLPTIRRLQANKQMQGPADPALQGEADEARRKTARLQRHRHRRGAAPGVQPCRPFDFFRALRGG